MARNKFKKIGNAYWDENRRHRNKVVAIRKESMATYFKQRCSKNDKTFWDTIAPFVTDKRNKNANDIVLKDGDDVVSDPAKVTEIFNTFFFQRSFNYRFPRWNRIGWRCATES